MLKYIANRVLSGVITVYFLATSTFAVMHFIPGDPITSNKAMSPEIRANVMREYGLDKPILEQYTIYLTNMLKGNFGISFTQHNRSVNDIIVKHFPISAVVGLVALFIAVTGGILFGTLTALFRNRFPDHVIMVMVIMCISIPSFAMATLFQYTLTEIRKNFGIELFPVGGWPATDSEGRQVFELRYMFMPALVLGLFSMAFITRLMRSSLLEVIGQDYVRTAKAKGLPAVRIFFQHQLRNAILPVITYLGPTIAFVTTGGFVSETVFAIPGLGRYFVQAMQQLDYTVIMGLTVFYGSFLVFMILVVDIAYGFIDPRIKISGK